jgi:hypothetical protein
MTTPTVKLIDITSDLSAHPTSADHNSQFGALTDRSASLAGRAPSVVTTIRRIQTAHACRRRQANYAGGRGVLP